jgi:hypothetical protein
MQPADPETDAMPRMDIPPPLFYLSEPCSELMAALAAAAADLKNPKKDSEAKIDLKAGGGYSYRYADLATTLDEIRPAIAKHGLALIQLPFVNHDGPSVLTIISHKSGQRIMARLDLPVSFQGSGRDAAKDLGSAITYLRRYAVTSAFPIASDEDSDASKIQGGAKQRPATPTSAPRPAPVNAPAAPTRPLPAMPAKQAWLGQFEFIRKANIERERLGAAMFNEVLGAHGWTNLEEIPDSPKARKVYDELMNRAVRAFFATDEDLPPELREVK